MKKLSLNHYLQKTEPHAVKQNIAAYFMITLVIILAISAENMILCSFEAFTLSINNMSLGRTDKKIFSIFISNIAHDMFIL